MRKLVLLVMLLGTTQVSADWYSTGELKFRVDGRENGRSDVLGRAQVEVVGSFVENVTLRMEFEANSEATTSSPDAEIRNLLLTWQAVEFASLFVGWQQQVWGRADEINPLDFAFAEDRRWYYLEDRDERSMTRFSIGSQFVWGDSRLSLFYFPKAEQDLLPEEDSIWCDRTCEYQKPDYQKNLFTDMGFVVQQDARSEPDNEWAARFTSRVGEIDYGAAVYYGSDHLTRTERIFVAPAVVQLNTREFQSLSYGVDAAYAWDGFVFRTEIAQYNDVVLYLKPTSPQYALDEDGLQEVDATAAILSMDYTTETDWYFNVQYQDVWLSEQEAMLILPRELKLATAQIAKTFYDPEVKVEWTTLFDDDKDGGFTKLAVQWQKTMQWSLSVGALVFKGKNDIEDYGFFEKNNSLYFSTHYRF